MIKIIILLVLITTAKSALAITIGPAPEGNPKIIATKAIKEAEHPCKKVKSATRNQDGSVSAICTNREDYRIFTVEGKVISMRCSAARKLGVSGC